MAQTDPTAEDSVTAQELFDAAAKLSPEERDTFLDETCGRGTALRLKIEQMLEAETKGQLPSGFPFPDTREGILRVGREGDSIGRYKLLQRIGEGGFGEVWMAEQKEPVKRRVALKIIKLGMDTKQVVARFEAERQALALMDHPNIAKVFDGGATENGRPYFVMELVKGVPITEYCETHNIGTDERLKLFIQVCQAIQHAHQKGIIHRDIKPSNILVSIQDGIPVPKV
ncbi:MAG TPA: serine/threonine-protein kinase, partial [Verrucomicrobiae bacterium]|nr:serine/threonine-protein kinase [Verrucomicrobiae bacterium]